jgi:hypothetical protein
MPPATSGASGPAAYKAGKIAAVPGKTGKKKSRASVVAEQRASAEAAMDRRKRKADEALEKEAAKAKAKAVKPTGNMYNYLNQEEPVIQDALPSDMPTPVQADDVLSADSDDDSDDDEVDDDERTDSGGNETAPKPPGFMPESAPIEGGQQNVPMDTEEPEKEPEETGGGFQPPRVVSEKEPEGSAEPTGEFDEEPDEEMERQAADDEQELEQNPEQEIQPASEPATAVQLDSAQPARPQRKRPPLTWLQCQRPDAGKDKVTPRNVTDAMHVVILDGTDTEREGGVAPNFPKKMAGADIGLADGPYWFAFASQAEATAFLDATAGILMVDCDDDESFACKIFIDHQTRDRQAQALSDAFGFWGELLLGRAALCATPAEGAALLKEQLNIYITAIKWPRAKDGAPPNRTKLCFRAMHIPGEEPKHPACITIQCEHLALPARYRIQEGTYPNRCDRCHALLAACRCAAAKADKDAERDNRKKMAAENRETRRRKAESKAAGPGSAVSSGTRTAAQKVERNRAIKEMTARCKAAGLCPFFQMGNGCNFNTGNCHNGKHEVTPASNPPLPH